MAFIPQQLRLENDRVSLRLLTEDDYKFLLPFAIHESDIWRFSLVKASGAEGMKKYIDIAVKEWQKDQSFPFIVFDKLSGTYAGSTRYYDIQSEQKSVQIGYTWYGKAFQGTGLNKNCKYLLLEYAFETLGIERVEFRADAENSRSIAAMKAIGCITEGTLRNHLEKEGRGRIDSVILSILKEEWYNEVKSDLQMKIISLL